MYPNVLLLPTGLLKSSGKFSTVSIFSSGVPFHSQSLFFSLSQPEACFYSKTLFLNFDLFETQSSYEKVLTEQKDCILITNMQ